MWRLFKLCSLSLAIYFAVFSALVDRPLSLGVLRLELLQKTTRLAAMPSPKLVVLAGSNGPYSHSCVVLTALLRMPCENAGIAVGIGLDDLFVRYEPNLRRGDVVYMPMELQQYTATAREYQASVDDEFLLRHDRGVLLALPFARIVGAGFCCSFADLMDAVAEMPLGERGLIKPASLLSTEYDTQGDRIDNDLSSRDAALLQKEPRMVPSASEIGAGYGTALIAAFVARESRKGVIVIGGLPVDFSSVHMPDSVIYAIGATYTGNGGFFIVLPNDSEYPPADFFNSEDHLVKPCQYMHSIFVAQGLAAFLHMPAESPPSSVRLLAADCPSAARSIATN
jgi:hypothetical protein